MPRTLPLTKAVSGRRRRTQLSARSSQAPVEIIGRRIYAIRGGRRYLPSSVLNSARAVQMNILIIRAFVKLREALIAHRDVARKIERLEQTQKNQAHALAFVVQEIQDLDKKMVCEFQSLTAVPRRKQRIGFIVAPR